jgi:site-specific recombinase XerD
MNSTVRSVLLDLGSQRKRPSDPSEPVFTCRHAQADKFFPRTVEKARKALAARGKDASRLEGFTWHGNRHTFASRLAMAGADLLTIKEVGGWKTLAMVQRYAHLAPNRLHEAVERLVSNGTAELARN